MLTVWSGTFIKIKAGKAIIPIGKYRKPILGPINNTKVRVSPKVGTISYLMVLDVLQGTRRVIFLLETADDMHYQEAKKGSQKVQRPSQRFHWRLLPPMAALNWWTGWSILFQSNLNRLTPKRLRSKKKVLRFWNFPATESGIFVCSVALILDLKESGRFWCFCDFATRGMLKK